jgi:hypothetical protein
LFSRSFDSLMLLLGRRIMLAAGVVPPVTLEAARSAQCHATCQDDPKI